MGIQKKSPEFFQMISTAGTAPDSAPMNPETCPSIIIDKYLSCG